MRRMFLMKAALCGAMVLSFGCIAYAQQPRQAKQKEAPKGTAELRAAAKAPS